MRVAGRSIREAAAPVELVYYECSETKEEAMRREYAIKQMNRRQKLSLIAQQGETDYE